MVEMRIFMLVICFILTVKGRVTCYLTRKKNLVTVAGLIYGGWVGGGGGSGVLHMVGLK